MSKKLNVIFISGPRCSGKSTLIRTMISELCDRPPHYLRLVPVDGQEPRLTLLGDLKAAGLASWKRINYDADRVFEFLPECLTEIAAMGGSKTVLLEADADPGLRFAFPYDRRIFLVPAPSRVDEVFRTPDEAAVALRGVMDDTAAFASEIFGLFDPDAEEDDGAELQTIARRGVVTEERLEISAIQMRRFMSSPLGGEIASRIQLQPEYHSLMESDLTIINRRDSDDDEILAQCMAKIQLLILRLGGGKMSKPALTHCNLLDLADPLRDDLLEKLRHLVCN